MIRRSSGVVGAAGGLGAVAIVTLVYLRWLHVVNSATVSTSFLLIVLVVAATSRLWAALATSVCAVLVFNFFFLPPVRTFVISDPQNWVALFAFLVVSLVASRLATAARDREQEAVGRRDELGRLFDLSRDVLGMTESREAIAGLARSVARRFDLQFVGIALPRAGAWDIFDAGTQSILLDLAGLNDAFAAAQSSLEFDAYSRTYAGHQTLEAGGHTVRLVPLRVGTRPIGLLAAAGRPVEAGTLDTLAGVVAIAIERAKFLEERKAAELMRQSDQLKTALLASLSHDLRTPLTAIRVAASNLQASWLTADERREQNDLILTEVERLTRLFENILEMARIDAGAIQTKPRWTYPSEIVAAAREQVEHTIAHHTLRVHVADDVPVQLDPRLTSTALARLLENAAQYAPAGSTIDLRAQVTGEGLVLEVADRGPGLDPADLPYVFDRFYRGASARVHGSGTGMGLPIVRGLLAVVHARVWAENRPDGGAQFTIAVPAPVREPHGLPTS